MSGGYFNYDQYRINDIADQIERFVANNDRYEFPDSVLIQFREALYYLKMASIYTQRIDWFLCGDDSIESFLGRLKEDVERVVNK